MSYSLHAHWPCLSLASKFYSLLYLEYGVFVFLLLCYFVIVHIIWFLAFIITALFQRVSLLRIVLSYVSWLDSEKGIGTENGCHSFFHALFVYFNERRWQHGGSKLGGNSRKGGRLTINAHPLFIFFTFIWSESTKSITWYNLLLRLATPLLNSFYKLRKKSCFECCLMTSRCVINFYLRSYF